jgi:hypothetical protein
MPKLAVWHGHDACALDPSLSQQSCLDFLWMHIFPARDKHVIQAPKHVQKAILIHTPVIACPKPAPLIEGLPQAISRDIARKPRRASQLNLAIFSNAEFAMR